MSKAFKYLFLVYAAGAGLIGVLLLLIPRQFPGWIHWRPIELIANRLFGAALLGLAWGSFRGWRASEWAQVAILVEVEAFFCTLAAVGVARHLLIGVSGCCLGGVCYFSGLCRRLDCLLRCGATTRPRSCNTLSPPVLAPTRFFLTSPAVC